MDRQSFLSSFMGTMRPKPKLLICIIFLVSWFLFASASGEVQNNERIKEFFDVDDWNDDYEEDPITNNIIDQMLENLKKTEQIDPYYLHEDYEMDIIETFLIPWDPCLKTCKIKLINGTIYGLTNMSRYDNGVMTNDGDDLIIQVRLQTYNTILEGILCVNLIGLKVTNAPFRNYVEYQVQYLDLAIGKQNKVRLRELRVEKVKNLRVEFTKFQDSKLLKKFSNMLSEKLLAMMKDQLEEIATKVFFPILSTEFKYMSKSETAHRFKSE